MPPLLRGLPRAVWAATAFFFASLLVWSVTIPMFRGPDEADHVSAVLYAADTHEWPGFKEMPMLSSVLEARQVSGYRWYTDPPVIRPSLTAADAEAVRREVPFDELAEGESVWWNKSAQHPPLYYRLVGSLHPMTSGLPWDGETWFFRLASLLLVCPLPLIAAAMARRLGAGRSVIVASAFAVCAVPQLGVVGGTVNNDNLLNGAGAWLALGTVAVLTGDLRSRTAAWTGLAAAAALLAKAWALPLVGVTVVAYALAGARSKSWRAVGPPVAVFTGISMLGGWWWIRNLALYGTLQPSGHTDPLPEPLPLSEAVTLAAGRFAGWFPSRFWSTLSVKTGEEAYPRWIPTVLCLALVFLVVGAFVGAKRIGVPRTTLGVLTAPAVLILAIMLIEAVRFAQETGRPSGIQGRYLYGTITAILVVAVAGLSVLARHRALAMGVGLFAAVFTLVSIAQAVSYHYGEARWSNPFAAFPDLLAWSPVPTAVTVGFFALFLGAALWVAGEAMSSNIPEASRARQR